MDEKSAWECDILPRDNMPHPLVRHIAPQGDSDFLWAEAHERSYTAKTNMRGRMLCRSHKMSQGEMPRPQFTAPPVFAPLMANTISYKKFARDNAEPLY